MNFIKKLLIIFFFFGCNIINAQEDIEKMALKTFTFEEVEKLHQQKPKPILVFIYTDWCKICFGMKKNTFQNEEVIQLLNDKFYFIQLNGEEKKDINFLGKKFVYKPSGNKTGTHELAKELASIKGRISYPTTTILSDTFLIDVQIDFYMNRKKFYKLLKSYLK